MLFKVNTMFWDQNEGTGYRHVSVEYNDRVLLSVTAHNVSGAWQAQVIPMGFSFNLDEIQAFSDMFSVLPGLMEFLCKESMTVEEIQEYLLTIQ